MTDEEENEKEQLKFEQDKIILALHVKPVINPKFEISQRIDLLKNYLVKNGVTTLVLGVSGGIDSTCASKLSQLAVDDLNHEFHTDKYQFIAVRLPYGKQADEADAMEAINWVKPSQVFRVNIKPATDALTKSIDKNRKTVTDFNQGNIKARERMVAQYSIAEANHGIVVGTDHAAEGIVAFYTKFGDGASDICPLQGLDKKQVKQCLAELNAPKHLLNKTPTADLESNHPDQPDAVELGTSYKNVDDFLEGKTVPKKVAKLLITKYKKSAHKRNLPVNLWSTFWKDN